MATSGEKRWPSLGNFVAASGENPMAIETQPGSSLEVLTGRCAGLSWPVADNPQVDRTDIGRIKKSGALRLAVMAARVIAG